MHRELVLLESEQEMRKSETGRSLFSANVNFKNKERIIKIICVCVCMSFLILSLSYLEKCKRS